MLSFRGFFLWFNFRPDILRIHQRIAPREHSAKGGHHPSRSVVGPSWFDLPLPEQRLCSRGPSAPFERHHRFIVGPRNRSAKLFDSR